MTMPDGRNVVAVSYRPAQAGHRWVILAHGYGRDHRYVRDYAEVYLKQGYHVLSPDLCAAGESDGQYRKVRKLPNGRLKSRNPMRMQKLYCTEYLWGLPR